jgi:hypothetical protein
MPPAVNVMIDEPFDHTAHDVVLENEGVTDFGGTGNPGNWQPTDLIPARVPEFFSPNNSYCSRASIQMTSRWHPTKERSRNGLT